MRRNRLKGAPEQRTGVFVTLYDLHDVINDLNELRIVRDLVAEFIREKVRDESLLHFKIGKAINRG